MKPYPLVLLFFSCVALMTAGEKFTVAFAQDTMTNDWRASQVNDVKEALQAYSDIRFIYTDAQKETSRQIKDIEDLAAAGIDVLISSPRDADIMTPILSDVYKKGIPVILLSRKIKGDDYTTYIHPDNKAIAGKAARFIADKLGNKGTVLMLKGVPSASSAISRSRGFYDEMKKHPGITVIEKTANYLRGDAIKTMEELMAEGHLIDGIFAQSDSMAVGAIMVLQKYGVDTKKMVIVGIDYVKEGRELIRQGLMDASFKNPTGGQEAARAAAEIVHGREVPREIIIDSVMVTEENVNRIEPIF